MRIGELAKRTGTAPRMLRYYEEQGLITPTRLDNGYRDYDDYLVDRVMKIRGLASAGILSRIITYILPCLNQREAIVVRAADPELREILVRERDRMTQNIDFLVQNRDSITRYIDAIDAAA